MEKYRIYQNEETDKYDIYDVYGRYIVSCNNPKTAEEVKKLLINDSPVKKDDVDIMDEVNRINDIKEPYREPANRNSILNTPIAEKVRDLMSKYK